jgi:DNA-binding transcriptional MerR regulator
MTVAIRDSTLPSKLFFRIGEVASLVGVEPHVLRYWEREFRSIRPTKSAKGQRVYSRRDVENLLRVRDLLYRDGFTIAGARKRLHRGSEMETPSPADALRTHEVEVERETERDLEPTHAAADVADVERDEGKDAIPLALDATAGTTLMPSHASREEREIELAPSSQVAGRVDAVVQGKLTALRAEVEAFLDELEAGA